MRRQYRVAGSAFRAIDRRDVHAAHHLSSAGLGCSPRRVEARLRRTGRRAVGIDFRLTEAAKPIGSPSWRRPRDARLLDLLWRNRCGELDMSVAMVITNRPDLSDEVHPSGVPFIYARHARRFRTEPNGASSTCYAETSIWWRWPAAR
jgi:hypothetical protein